MESLTSWGFISPTTPDKLQRLKEYYDTQIKPKKETLSTKISEKLLAVLLNVTGETTQTNTLTPTLTENAKVGLEVLFYFLMSDDEFQDAVERKESYFLAKQLNLVAHMKLADNEHVNMTKDFIVFMIRNFPKFEAWLNEVQKQVDETPTKMLTRMSVDIPRLSQDGHLPAEGSYYDTDPRIVLKIFKTDPETGLMSNEVQARLERYGENRLPEPPPVSPLKILFRQVSDFMVLILFVVCIASFAMQKWIEAGALFVVVFSNVIIGFVQEYKAEKTLQALKLLTVQTAKVQRGSKQEVVEATELVPGDIVFLDEGDSIPADIRMFEVSNLQVIESVLTGESNPITKTTEAIKKTGLTVGDRTNMVFMSTVVSKGRGRGVVVATGANTEVGKISKALSKPKTRKTLLQKRLASLGRILVVLSVVLCSLVVGIGLIRTYDDKGKVVGKDVEVWIKVGISLAVSVIPEGLVAVTTITYTIGIQRMAQRHAVVRKLPAVETVGSITTICSDKTGTLTEGKMTATRLWAGLKEFVITGTGLSPEGEFQHKDQTADTQEFPALKMALMICSLCNNSTLEKDSETNRWKSTGDPTEVALLVATLKAKLGKDHWTEKENFKFVAEAPFDSDRKRMSTVYKRADGTGFIMAKGAPESIVPLCSSILDRKNQPAEKSEKLVKKIEKANIKLGELGLRVLGLGYKELSAEEVAAVDPNDVEAIESKGQFTFVALAGMIDPPRKEVKPTILGCKDAGIRVCMITGDHPRTAFSIGKQLGIIDDNQEDLVVTGVQLAAMSKADLAALEHFPTIFARVSPADKLKIVNALQFKGEICAMTGDGTNDAPAIKNADIGIAMGVGSTDMAKNSADIILTDDNFVTIVEAIKEGRRTYDNIKKFVSYLLACNSAEIYVMLFSVIIGLPIPFTPIMILWANLIADVPPALALGLDPAVPNIMKRLPRDPKKGIFNLKVLIMLIFYGFSMSAITLSVYSVAIYVEGYDVDEDDNEKPGPAKQLAFISLTLMQLFHSFFIRDINTVFSKDIVSNKFLLEGVTLSIVLLVFGCYCPGFNEIIGQHPPAWYDWFKAALCVVVHLMFVEIFKLVYRIWSRKSLKEKPYRMFYNDL